MSEVAPQEPKETKETKETKESETDDGLYDLLTNRAIYKNRKGGDKFNEISESEQQEYINLFLSDLENDDETKRNNAAYALKKRYIRDKIAVNVLIRKFEEKSVFIKITVVEVLGLKGEWPALIEAEVLEDNNPLVRKAAVEALGKIGNKKAINTFLKILKDDDDPSVWKAAVEALGKIGEIRDRKVNLSLIEKLKETDSSLLIATLDTIAKIGSRDYYMLSPVFELTKHENNDVKKAAKITYETLTL